jgi:hypothetical protein
MDCQADRDPYTEGATPERDRQRHRMVAADDREEAELLRVRDLEL